MEALLPADASVGAGAVTLFQVACPSAGSCTAVGQYASSGHLRGLLLDESQRAWSSGVEAPLPVNAAPPFGSSVHSVACPSAGNCTAVGQHTDSVGGTPGMTQGLLLDESQGTWSRAIDAPLPSNAPTAPGGNPNVSLNSVACPSAGNCSAVGTYVDSSGDTQALLLTESGGTWSTGVDAPLPANASTVFSSLLRVSCGSPGNCTAIGTYTDGSSNIQGLLLSESGGRWSTGLEAPLPANAATNPDVTLYSVACPSAGNCSAVGNYTDTFGHVQVLLLSESEGTWATGVEAALPANASVSGGSFLEPIVCPSAGNCTAVGAYEVEQGLSVTRQPLLLSESQGAWSTGEAAALPANAGTNGGSGLLSVACPSVGNCTAVGQYTDGAGNIQGLLTSEFQGSWAAGMEAPLPANALAALGPGASLSSVACPSLGYCTAVGDYSDTSGNEQGLLINAAPAIPTVTVTAPATGTAGTALAASAISAALELGSDPIGAITFNVIGPQPSPPGSCSSGATVVSSSAVAGNGAYRSPAGFTPAAAGDYWWYASYGGDVGDNPAASPCGPSMAETVVGPAVGTASLKRVKVSRTSVRVRVGCSGSGPCLIKLTLAATERLKRGKVVAISAGEREHNIVKRRVVLATARAMLGAGQTTTIRLALKAAARRLLARFHTLKARMTVTQSTTIVASRTLTFHARRRSGAADAG